MKYRQFGKGKYPYASEHNLAQNYIEANAKELAQDGHITGICTSSGTLVADTDPHTVLIDNYIARTPYGERIYITSTALNIEPDTAVPAGLELWVTVYAEYLYLLSESDIASTGIAYYKDYQNDYTFVIITGDLSSTGTAVKSEISSSGVLLFDVLYDNTLYTTGLLSDSDINIDRQTRYWHTHVNLTQLELITDGLHDVRTTNPHNETSLSIGLQNVTNNIQIRKISSSTIGNIPSWDGTSGEILDNGYTVETVLIGSSTGIPTASAAKTYADNLVELENVLIYKGTYSVSSYVLPAANAGHIYKIIGNGILGNSSTGIGVTNDELIVCLADSTPEGIYSDVGQYWGFLQNKNEIYVFGNGSSVAENIAVFSGSTGIIIKDSGYASQAATTSQIGFVKLSDSYIGTSSGLAVTEKALSDGLAQWSNVTNDAQLKREAGDYNTFTGIDPADLDTSLILIEDSEDTYSKKTRQVQEVILNLDDAIHLTSSGEIFSLDEKLIPSDDDLLLIEDSEDSYNKKKIKVSNILVGSTGYVIVNFTNPGNTSTGLLGSTSTGDIGELSITSSGLRDIFIYSNLDYLNYYPSIINVWETTGNLNTARQGLAGAGTQNAGLSFGGYTTPYLVVTEKFNGSTWTATGDLNTARSSLAGAGTQNTGLSIGGITTGSTESAVTEKFNGSIWTATGDLNTARYGLAGCGTQNSGLSFGGKITTNSAITEKFNGSTWATSGNLNNSRQALAGCGTQNAGLSFGGSTGSDSVVTEKFNGSTWVATGSLNTARQLLAGCGTQNAGLSFGGYTGSLSAISEKFNGTSWVATGSLNTAGYYLAGCGTQNSGLSFGGYIGGPSAITEKFKEPYKLKLEITAIENSSGSIVTQRIDISTYESNYSFKIKCPAIISYGIVCEREYDTLSSMGLATSTGLNKLNYGTWNLSGYLNTAVYANGGCGLQCSALSFNGSTNVITPDYSSITEKFNGITWSNLSSNIIGRYSLAGIGTQNAALSFGGTTGSDSLVTEKFNGSTWTTFGDLNTARYTHGGSGIQNAAASFGGKNSGSLELGSTEEFNGATWSYTGDLNVSRTDIGGCGNKNSGLSIGGFTSIGTSLTTTEKFNGVSWNLASDLNEVNGYGSGVGIQNSAITVGSYTTEKFNGNTWYMSSNLVIGRNMVGGAGVQNAAASFGGLTGGSTPTTITEKYLYNADIAEIFATEDYYVNKSNVVIEY
jgi:hypothetical protein